MKFVIFLAILALATADQVSYPSHSGKIAPVFQGHTNKEYSRYGPMYSYEYPAHYGSEYAYQQLHQAEQFGQNALVYIQQQLVLGLVPQSAVTYIKEQLHQAEQYVQYALETAHQGYGSQSSSHYAAQHILQAQQYYKNVLHFIEQYNLPYFVEQIHYALQYVQYALQAAQQEHSYSGKGQGYNFMGLIQRYPSSQYGPYQYSSYIPYSQSAYQHESHGPLSYQYGSYEPYSQSAYQHGSYEPKSYQYGSNEPYHHGTYQGYGSFYPRTVAAAA